MAAPGRTIENLRPIRWRKSGADLLRGCVHESLGACHANLRSEERALGRAVAGPATQRALPPCQNAKAI